MRIVIETDDRTASAAATQPAIELSKSSVIDAGQPAADLLEAINSAASMAGETGIRNGGGTDGGAPSPELMQAVQGAESPRGTTGLYIVNGGPAASA